MSKALAISFYLILSAIFPLINGNENQYGKVMIKIENLKTTEGNLVISFYDDAGQFPDKPKEEFVIIVSKQELKENGYIWKSELLPFGTYSVSILDDKNENSRMDYFLGIPKEGFGFSNNIKPTLFKPKISFQETQFELNSTYKKMNIEVQYF
jgi:uncharacterized protein (DUF2141 family)